MAGYTLVLDIGEYSLVSGAIALTSSRFYTGGAYVLTGTDAVFERSIAGNAGIYAITGTTVTLIWNQSLGTLYTLALDGTTYTLTGGNLTILRGYNNDTS